MCRARRIDTYTHASTFGLVAPEDMAAAAHEGRTGLVLLGGPGRRRAEAELEMPARTSESITDCPSIDHIRASQWMQLLMV